MYDVWSSSDEDGHALAEGAGAPVRPERPGHVGARSPFFDPAQLDLFKAAARRVGPDHHALVVILSKTGIEMSALARLGPRDYEGRLLRWFPSRLWHRVECAVEDPELDGALRTFLRGPPRTADRLDYMLRQVCAASGQPDFADVTGTTLRLTSGLHMLEAHEEPGRVAERLRLPLSTIMQIANEAGLRGPQGTPGRAGTEAP